MPPSIRGIWGRLLTVRDEAAELLDPRRRRYRDLSLPEWERGVGFNGQSFYTDPMNTPFVRREAMGAGVAAAAA